MSDARKKQPAEEDHDTVTSAYAPTVLESAAKAEAPIGKSVTEFLLKNPPKVAGVDLGSGPDRAVFVEIADGDAVEIEEWHARCLEDFGAKVLTAAVKSVPRWERMNWQQRHEFLRAQKERAGDEW